MELSSVIAPLTQAFIKCWRGRLLHTFYTEGTADFLLEQLSRCCVVLASCEPYIHIYSFFEKGVLYTFDSLTLTCVSCLCVAKDRGHWRQTDGRSDFNSSKWAVKHFIASKSTSNQTHFSPFSHTWLQYKRQTKTLQKASAQIMSSLTDWVFFCCCFCWSLSVAIAGFTQEVRRKQTSLFNDPAIRRFLW